MWRTKQDLQSPNTWPLSPRGMHGAGILPPVQSWPTLFAPIPPAGSLCPVLISVFAVLGGPNTPPALRGNLRMSHGAGSRLKPTLNPARELLRLLG